MWCTIACPVELKLYLPFVRCLEDKENKDHAEMGARSTSPFLIARQSSELCGSSSGATPRKSSGSSAHTRRPFKWYGTSAAVTRGPLSQCLLRPQPLLNLDLNIAPNFPQEPRGGTFRKLPIYSAQNVRVHGLLSDIVVTYGPHCNSYVLLLFCQKSRCKPPPDSQVEAGTERLVCV